MHLYREVFFLFTLFSVAAGFFYNKNSRGIYLFFSAIYLLMVLLKPVGAYPDDKSYIDLLHQFRNDDLPAHNAGRDFLYYYLTYILSLVFFDKLVLNMVVFASVCIKLFVVGRLTNYSLLAFYFFVALSSQIADLTTIRNSLATAFIYLSIYFFVRKEYKKSLTAYAFSIVTHLNTILFIPAALFINKYIYSYRYVVLIIAIVFSFSGFSVTSFDLSGFAAADLYLSQIGSDVVIEINRFKLSTSVIIILIFWLDFKLKNKTETYWLFQGAMLSQLTPMLFFWIPVLAGRIGDLMLPFLILYVGHRSNELTILQRFSVAFVAVMMIINYLYINPLFLRDAMVVF